MFSLSDQPLLFVDCQTTGATPANAHLLEVGWAVGRACNQLAPEVVTRLITLPEDQILPARIKKITGISEGDMACARQANLVAEELQNTLDKYELTYAVAHWAQFEKTFLTDCFAKNTPEKTHPLEYICTCQIAKKLYPDLPSRAIRAVGGYFGLSVDEMKRAHGHVETTYFIWQKLTQELEQLGIKNVTELVEWLKPAVKIATKTSAKGDTKNNSNSNSKNNSKNNTESNTKNTVKAAASGKYLLPLERFTRLDLPDQPGVYRMLNGNGKILYVGKATSLKSRVNSYFTGRKGKDSKTKELISQVFDLNVSPMATPLEAALLENDLIKEHDPPYNRALRKRERSLVYFSYDFASSSVVADQWHVLGPFPRGSTIESLMLLAQGLQTKSFDPGLFWGLLDQESTDRAVSLFFAQYKSIDVLGNDQIGEQISQQISVRSLLALGLSFYRRQLLDALIPEEGGASAACISRHIHVAGGVQSLSLIYFLGQPPVEADEIEGQETATEDMESDKVGEIQEVAGGNDQDDMEALSDEELVQMVRGLITGSARAYALARTLGRLLDATISYEEKKRRRKLVFERGYLILSEDISHSSGAEEGAVRLFKPADRGNPIASMDLATYDRMRVLLGEIRRLYSRGHWISLLKADLVIS